MEELLADFTQNLSLLRAAKPELPVTAAQ